jgi:hypothetical protein
MTLPTLRPFSRTFPAVSVLTALIAPASAAAQCELARLEASTGLDGDYFGVVDIDGRNVVVGARWTDVAAGSAYVYQLERAPAGTGDVIFWTEDGILEADDRTQGDNFGEKVAISGNKVVIAAKGDDDNGSLSGSAYVFARSGGAWVQEAKLLPDSGGPNNQFGGDVDIDGDRIVVGARGHQGDRGAAYAFHYDGATWIQQPKIQPSDIGDLHIFGAAVTILGDRMAVSALGDDTHAINSGAIYVFHWDGAAWVEEAKLTAPQLTTQGDNLGFSLDFGEDDGWLVAGTDGPESAYVFRRTPNGWNPEPVAELQPSDGDFGDSFGFSVAGYGRRVIVGAPYGGPAATGKAYVYTRTGNSWSETAILTASDAVQFDEYGESVALHGRLGIVGSPLHPFEFGPGHAYVIGMDAGLCASPAGDD